MCSSILTSNCKHYPEKINTSGGQHFTFMCYYWDNLTTTAVMPAACEMMFWFIMGVYRCIVVYQDHYPDNAMYLVIHIQRVHSHDINQAWPIKNKCILLNSIICHIATITDSYLSTLHEEICWGWVEDAKFGAWKTDQWYYIDKCVRITLLFTWWR